MPILSLRLCLIIAVMFGFSHHVEATIYDQPQMTQYEIKQLVANEAAANPTVPVSLALGVAAVESDFRAKVVSHAGAIGVMQIMPATAKGEFGVDKAVLFDPLTNVRIGILFLERLYHQYNQNWEHALSHYNGGSLKKRGGHFVPHSYTKGYVRKVLGHARQFASNDVETKLVNALAKTNHNIRSQQQIDHQQALAVTTMLDNGGDWRANLLAADQFLNPQTAENMPELQKTASLSKQSYQAYANHIPQTYNGRWKSNRVINQLRHRAQTRARILAKINN